MDCERYHSQVQTPDLTLRSLDGRFGVRLGPRQFETLMGLCRKSGSMETGGLLVGRYNETRDTADVTRVWGPPSDSVRRRTNFWRGTSGLQEKLDSLWTSQEYYLGEWHYHPTGAGHPSKTDMRQMARISRSSTYNCPEPILIVVGGTDLRVVGHVFPRCERPVRLDSMGRGFPHKWEHQESATFNS